MPSAGGEAALRGAVDNAQIRRWLNSSIAYATCDQLPYASVAALQAVKQRCAELWAMNKAIAQAMWKEWAGLRAAELTPQLVVRVNHTITITITVVIVLQCKSY